MPPQEEYCILLDEADEAFDKELLVPRKDKQFTGIASVRDHVIISFTATLSTYWKNTLVHSTLSREEDILDFTASYKIVDSDGAHQVGYDIYPSDNSTNMMRDCVYAIKS